MKKYYTFALLIFCVLGVGVSVVFELFYIGRPIHDRRALLRSINIELSVDRLAEGWLEALDADIYVDMMWRDGDFQTWREDGVSIYLYENDTLRFWGNHLYRAEVDSVFDLTKSTIQTFDGHSVIVHSLEQKGRQAVMVLNLIDRNVGANRSIFEHDNVELVAINDPQIGDVVDTNWGAFKIVPPLESIPPWYISVFGWFAFFAGVLAFKRALRYKTTKYNALQRLSLFFVSMLFLRVLTYFIDVPHGGSLSLSSLDSLLITQLLVLMVVQYAYQLRYKIRQQIETFSKAGRYALLLFLTLFINCVVLYFHYAMVQIIYANSVTVELYNVLAIEPHTLFFYCVCAVFVALRVLYGRFFALTLGGFPFWLRITLSVSIMLVLVMPIEGQIGNTGYMLVCFHVIFLTVSYLTRSYKDGRVFLYDLIVFTSYILLFSAVEASSAKRMEAERYAAELSTKSIDDSDWSSPSTPRGGMTYSIITTDEVMLKAGHNLDAQALLPYLDTKNDTLIVIGDFAHNIKRSRLGDAVVVVSYQRTSFMDIVSLFAYLFIWLFVVSGLVLRLSAMYIFHQYNPRSMLYRIRAVIFCVVLISMLTVGWVVYRYSASTYRVNQRQMLNTSVQSLLRSFNLYCKEHPKDSAQVKWYAGLGSSQGLVVNLYDMSARRIDGSVEHFSSSRLLDEAYRRLSIQELPYFDRYATARDHRFTVAYVPMFWRTQKVGYMSVVLVDKADMMTRYSLLGNIFNVFVVLFLLSILLSMGLYAIISKPLNVLYDGLSGIGQMQKIPLDPNVRLDDEVGVLIVQYNRMIDFLHDSYAALARAEREGAWREMARQVAHEIKNPLTPMRLKIQMLQRARLEGGDGVEQQLDSTLEVLLTQMDILSKIATEFSDLARMPQGSAVRLELSGLLRGAVGLYATTDTMEVRYEETEKGSGVYVNVEYAGLMRVVVNLLQNAMQAINGYGTILVRLRTEDSSALITIQDDGRGIPQEILDRIFEPNFTTKSSGSGLGLAISKQIVENSGGTIQASNLDCDTGAIFTITLPLCC